MLTAQRMQSLGIVAVVLVLGAAAEAVVARRFVGTPSQKQEKRARTELPPIRSDVPGIEIVNAHIEENVPGELTAEIIVENKTDCPIEAIAVVSGNFMVIDDYGLVTDKPKPIVEPHGTYTIDIPLQNLRANELTVIAAALYADGTEEGHEKVIQKIRDARERERVKRLEKEKNEPNANSND